MAKTLLFFRIFTCFQVEIRSAKKSLKLNHHLAARLSCSEVETVHQLRETM